MKTNVRLQDVMKTSLLVMDGKQSALSAAEHMKSMRVGSVLVKQKEDIVGIVTEKDLVRGALATNDVRITLKSLMSSPLMSIDKSTDVYTALVFLNKEGIRHLPVSEKGKIVGIVTFSDLLKIEPSMLETLHYREALAQEPTYGRLIKEVSK